MCACVCVPLYVRVKMCKQSDKYQQVLYINKYKQNRHDVTCNMKAETEIFIS